MPDRWRDLPDQERSSSGSCQRAPGRLPAPACDSRGIAYSSSIFSDSQLFCSKITLRSRWSAPCSVEAGLLGTHPPVNDRREHGNRPLKIRDRRIDRLAVCPKHRLVLRPKCELDRLQNAILNPGDRKLWFAEHLLVQKYRIERKHRAVSALLDVAMPKPVQTRKENRGIEALRPVKQPRRRAMMLHQEQPLIQSMRIDLNPKAGRQQPETLG